MLDDVFGELSTRSAISLDRSALRSSLNGLGGELTLKPDTKFAIDAARSSRFSEAWSLGGGKPWGWVDDTDEWTGAVISKGVVSHCLTVNYVARSEAAPESCVPDLLLYLTNKDDIVRD